jgi:hypothetical protein
MLQSHRPGGRSLCLPRAVPYCSHPDPPHSGTVLADGLVSIRPPVALDGDYGSPARPEYRRIGAEAFAAVQALLDRGLIDTHPTNIMAGGWDGVIEGSALIRS